MTDEEIVDQIVRECACSRKRFAELSQLRAGDRMKMPLSVLTAEFLTGCAQTAAFLALNDGDVTPQQMERALVIAANRLGYKLRKASV